MVANNCRSLEHHINHPVVPVVTPFCYTRTPQYLILFGIRARFLRSSLTTNRMQTLQYLVFIPVFTRTGYCGLALGVGHTVLVSAATGPTQCLIGHRERGKCAGRPVGAVRLPAAGSETFARICPTVRRVCTRLPSAPIAPVSTMNEDARVQRDNGDLSEKVIICDPAGFDSLDVAVLLIDVVLAPVRPRQHCRHRPREEALLVPWDAGSKDITVSNAH
jgi:hypothetical protein